MKLLSRKQIDSKKWNAAVSHSPVENVFMYTWYLDSVCDHWSGLISDDYSTILPVPYTRKAGVKQLILAPFTREYDIIGKDFRWSDAIRYLSSMFKSIHFRNASPDLLAGGKERCHQWVFLRTDFEAGYSTNAKRILKKADRFTLEKGQDPMILVDLFVENVAHKVDSISKEDLVRLRNLMNAALTENKGELLIVKENGEIVAAGFFLLDKKRVTYLKGAATEKGKKDGAMYFLIDRAMKEYKEHYDTFDFGGSDIDKVAAFYRKFGAHDRIYFDYTVNDLPFWFKALRRLAR